jgi:tetratricopeptide (TPR) repeat protein
VGTPSRAPPPDKLKAVAAVREQLSAVNAELVTGRVKEAEAHSVEAVTAARATNHAPVIAEALISRSRVLDHFQRNADAEAAAAEAASIAEGAGADALGALACARAIGSAVRLGQLREAQEWVRRGRALLDRSGGDDEAEHALESGQIALAALGDHLDEALLHAQRALELSRRLYGEHHHETARALSNLADAYMALGRPSDALAPAEDAARLEAEQSSGESPTLWIRWQNLISIDRMLGRYDEAEGLKELALRVCVPAFGEDGLPVSYLREAAAELDLARGKLDSARSEAERALTARAAVAPPPPTVAAVQIVLARVLLAQGHSVEALELAKKARESGEHLVGKTHSALAGPLTVEGLALLSLHRASDAVEPLERAVVLRSAHPAAPGEAAESRFAAAQALVETKRAPLPYALTLAELASAELAQWPHLAARKTQVDAWLDAQRSQH